MSLADEVDRDSCDTALGERVRVLETEHAEMLKLMRMFKEFMGERLQADGLNAIPPFGAMYFAEQFVVEYDRRHRIDARAKGGG